MPQGVVQLAYLGPQDKLLTGDPQMSYFVTVFKRSTRFAIESARQYFIGGADFGKTSDVVLEKIGDLVHQMFLQVKLPELNSLVPNLSEGEVYGYVNAIGHAMIQGVEIYIGNQKIDTLYGYWLEIWSELTLTAEKEDAYYKMIGKHKIFSAESNSKAMNLYIPLPFWFHRNVGLALPLIALQRQAVRLRFQFRDYRQVWTSNLPYLPTEDYNPFPNGIHFDSAFLWVDYIYLETEERRLFAESPHQYLIEQLQINNFNLYEENPLQKVDLNFNHPVKELIWAYQMESVLDYYPNANPNFFNFSDQLDAQNPLAQDPSISHKLQFENIDRFEERESFYFQVVQPYQYHTRVPRNFIHVYSFSFNPEDQQPSGTCNFSRIDNATFEVHIKENLPQMSIIAFAVNYNFLLITGGLCGVLYK
jgi:Major capsid protein N-terminus/Large eukaryotic DNA virus major capsid protein